MKQLPAQQHLAKYGIAISTLLLWGIARFKLSKLLKRYFQKRKLSAERRPAYMSLNRSDYPQRVRYCPFCDFSRFFFGFKGIRLRIIFFVVAYRIRDHSQKSIVFCTCNISIIYISLFFGSMSGNESNGTALIQDGVEYKIELGESFLNPQESGYYSLQCEYCRFINMNCYLFSWSEIFCFFYQIWN